MTREGKTYLRLEKRELWMASVDKVGSGDQGPVTIQTWGSSLTVLTWLNAGWWKLKNKGTREIVVLCEKQPILASQKLSRNQV